MRPLREVSVIQAKQFHTDDVNLLRIQASLLIDSLHEMQLKKYQQLIHGYNAVCHLNSNKNYYDQLYKKWSRQANQMQCLNSSLAFQQLFPYKPLNISEDKLPPKVYISMLQTSHLAVLEGIFPSISGINFTADVWFSEHLKGLVETVDLEFHCFTHPSTPPPPTPLSLSHTHTHTHTHKRKER